MKTINNIYLSKCNKSESKSSQVKYSTLPFYRLLPIVLQQIEYEAFAPGKKARAYDIALIIAEVYKLPASASVRISGNDLPAEMVAEIFAELTSEHIEQVIENYAKAKYEITHTKTYLRTALYNSVFELSSRAENELRAIGII